MYKLLFLFAMLVIKGSYADTSLGSCPTVDPMVGFNMNKFLGFWYIIQKTSTSTPCLSINITLDDEHEGQYKITEIEQHTTMLSSLHHEHHTTGVLTVPKPSEPARMVLDIPLTYGTATFTVFMTDYDNYAAIFTCKKLPLAHTWSAEILSRNPIIDMAFVDKVRTRLSSYNIDPFTLEIVAQSSCAPPGAKGALVQAATNIVSNVGEKINILTSDPKV